MIPENMTLKKVREKKMMRSGQPRVHERIQQILLEVFTMIACFQFHLREEKSKKAGWVKAGKYNNNSENLPI